MFSPISIVVFQHNMTFGCELVVLHATPFVFSKFPLHCLEVVWRYRFIEGEIHFGMPILQVSNTKMSLALNQPSRLLCTQIQTLSPSMHCHKWKHFINIACKTTNGNIIGTDSWYIVTLSYPFRATSWCWAWKWYDSTQMILIAQLLL